MHAMLIKNFRNLKNNLNHATLFTKKHPLSPLPLLTLILGAGGTKIDCKQILHLSFSSV